MATYTIPQGDTSEFELNVKDGSGEPMDITACKVWFSARRVDSDVLLWSLNSVDNPLQVVVVDALTGSMLLVLTPTETQDLPTHRPLDYDVQLKDTTGKVYTIEKGTMKVTPDVTRVTV